MGLCQLNSNAFKIAHEAAEASKKILEAKKEIAKLFGRPLVETNSYEVPSSICIHI